MDSRTQLGIQAPTLPLAVHGSNFSRNVSRPILLGRTSVGLGKSAVVMPSVTIDLTGNVSSTEDSKKHKLQPTNGSTSNVSRHPEVILVDDDVPEPPAKRLKTADEQKTFTTGEDTIVLRDEDNAHVGQLYRGRPLPTPPKTFRTANRLNDSKEDRADVESPSRKAHGLEPPSLATRLPAPRNVADFAPWTGNHPEDMMNENAVKSGYFDKSSSQNESSSARPSIWPNLSLKNNMGLQTLSYLYTSVLEKRQALGKCTNPSTFKPPPRVTVTDTKREAWLRDLANPDIPLRKQSRTIPHGIRGKVLMDQCLSKSIPIQRAVWLAKCVGANELRAFRRKGVSGVAAATGESKWVREWTMAVEHFVEGVVSTCGQLGWQARMSYAVKLALHFYLEQLLDRAHFLDWIVSSLADADNRSVPIWVVISQVYWKDLVRNVSRGRRLAVCLLTRLHVIKQTAADEDDPLQRRLEQLVDTLAVTNRACLIVPKIWEKCAYLITPHSFSCDTRVTDTIVQNIARRNARLSISAKVLLSRTQHPTRTLYDLLDQCDCIKSHGQITQQCLEVVGDPAELAQHLLEWASSPFREGLLRVYLAAAIIAELNQQGNDTDSGVFRFLDMAGQSGRVDESLAYQTIVRLVRLKGFSVGRYMQRLITGAGLETQQPNFVTGLLKVLPPYDLAIHTKTLRRTLLLRLEHSDEYAVTPHPDFSQRLLKALEIHGTEFPELPECSQLAHKLALAAAIRDCYRRALGEIDVSFSAFCYLRDALVYLDDVAGVLDLIAICRAPDAPTLATMIETVNLFAPIVAIFGVLDSTVDAILDRYRTLRNHYPLDRTLIVAFSDLLARLSNRAMTQSLLANDLLLCDQQSTSAVCSPASDNLVNVQAGEFELDNDIDAIFASGNTMDYKLMERIFSRILSRVGKPSRDTLFTQRSKVCGWLRQLRYFDIAAFEQLILKAMQYFLVNFNNNRSVLNPIVALVASGSLSLHAVLEATSELDSPDTAAAALTLITLPRTSIPRLTSEDIFRFQLAQSRLVDSQEGSIRMTFNKAFQSERIDVNSPEMQSLFILLTGRQTLGTPLMQPDISSDYGRSNAARLFRSVIEKRADVLSGSAMTPDSLLVLAQPLSIKTCDSALRFFMSTARDEDERRITNLLKQHVTSGSQVWPDLLQAAGESVQRALHDWTQEQLLIKVGNAEHDISRYLQVLALTHKAAASDDEGAILSTLVERLRETERQLSELVGENIGSMLQNLSRRLIMLLQVAALYVHTDCDTESTRQGRGALLVALCNVLASPRLQMQTPILETVFDMASTIYDTLPQVILASVIRGYETSKTRNVYVEAVLNATNSNDIDAWLALASQGQPATSQQQRVLTRHTSQHQVASSRPTPGSGPPTLPQKQGSFSVTTANKVLADSKITSFPLRRWEMMSDPTPVMSENDASLSLSLFGARKA